jgi:hypothetical protein
MPAAHAIAHVPDSLVVRLAQSPDSHAASAEQTDPIAPGLGIG